MGKRLRAVCWAYDTYTYQRNKPHGKRATRWHAFLLAWMGAHIVWSPGWSWLWTGPAWWLLKIGKRRLGDQEG